MARSTRTVRLRDWRGGLFTNASLRKIGESNASVLTNWRPLPNGDLELRLGSKFYNATSVEMGPVSGLHRLYRKDGLNQFWRVCVGFDMASDQAASATFVRLNYGATGLAAFPDERLSSVVYKDILYRIGEHSPGMKWDGIDRTTSLVEMHGNPAPTAVPAGAFVAGGSFDNAVTCFIRYTFEYGLEGELGESNPSPPSAAIGPSALNDKMNVTNILSPVSNYFWAAATGKKYVYRTIVNDVNAPYYRAGTVIGAATTVSITDANATVQGNQVLSFDNAMPPPCARYALIHKERLWLLWTLDALYGTGSQIHPSRAAYSKLSEGGDGIVDNFGVKDFVEVEKGANDELTGGISQFTNLLAFKTNSIWTINGNPPALSRDPISRQTGCFAPRSLVEHAGSVYFMGRNGPWRMTPGSLERLGENVQPVWDALGDDLRWTVACVDDDQVKFGVP